MPLNTTNSEVAYDKDKKEWYIKSVYYPKTSDTTDSTPNSGSDSLYSTDADSSSGQVLKEDNTIEYNTLEGTLEYIINENSVKITAGDTIVLKGFGKYLSGKYYVQDVTRSFSASGFSISATVINPDFSDSLKKFKTTDKKGVTKLNPPLAEGSTVVAPYKTYTVKEGDTLWLISKNFYGIGADYIKVFNNNTDIISDPNKLTVGQVLKIK